MIPELPTVSAVIIGFNDEAHIGRAIESALRQTHRPLEIIVVDDGSADRTLDIAKSYETEGVTVYSKMNGGAASARNYGAARSAGDYLAFLDSDDVWLPHKIKTMLEALPDTGELRVVFSSYWLMDESQNIIGRYTVDPEQDAVQTLLRFRNLMLPSIMMIPRSIFDQIGGYAEPLSPCEDGIFSLLACRACKTAAVSRPLVLYTHSIKGQGRAFVVDYKKTVADIQRVLDYAQARLSAAEFDVYRKHAWMDTFCKFAMYGQFAHARRLLRDQPINLGGLLSGFRGGLAVASAFTGIGFLALARAAYTWLFRRRYGSQLRTICTA